MSDLTSEEEKQLDTAIQNSADARKEYVRALRTRNPDLEYFMGEVEKTSETEQSLIVELAEKHGIEPESLRPLWPGWHYSGD